MVAGETLDDGGRDLILSAEQRFFSPVSFFSLFLNIMAFYFLFVYCVSSDAVGGAGIQRAVGALAAEVGVIACRGNHGAVISAKRGRKNE